MKEFNPYIYDVNQREMTEKYAPAVHAYLTKELVLEAMYQIKYVLWGKEATVNDLLVVLLEEGPTTLGDLTKGEMESEDWDSFYEREDWACFFEALTGVQFRERSRDDWYYYSYEYKPTEEDKARKHKADLAEIAYFENQQLEELLVDFTDNRYYLNDTKMLFVEYDDKEFRLHHIYYDGLHEYHEWVSKPMSAQSVDILIEELKEDVS